MAISDLLRTPTTLYQTPTTGAVVLMTVVGAPSTQPLAPGPPPRQNQKKPSSCFNKRQPSALSIPVSAILSTIDISPGGRAPLLPGGCERELNFTKALTVKVGGFRPGRLPRSMVGPVPSSWNANGQLSEWSKITGFSPLIDCADAPDT